MDESPSLGAKLLCEAQAQTNVPSTEKCSADRSPFEMTLRDVLKRACYNGKVSTARLRVIFDAPARSCAKNMWPR